MVTCVAICIVTPNGPKAKGTHRGHEGSTVGELRESMIEDASSTT